MTGPRHVSPITDAAALRRVHREILSVSFPPEELGSGDELVAWIDSGHFLAWGLVERGETVGAAIVEVHGVAEVAMLAWLAMHPGRRAAGGGRQLMDHVADALARDGVRVLLGEIEDPGGAASATYGDPARRARFYANLGARALLVPHVQPPAGPGLAPVPLLLFALPLGTGWGPPLADPILRFLTAYRDLAPGSPEHRRLAAALGGGVVPLGDLTAESFAATRRLDA